MSELVPGAHRITVHCGLPESRRSTAALQEAERMRDRGDHVALLDSDQIDDAVITAVNLTRQGPLLDLDDRSSPDYLQAVYPVAVRVLGRLLNEALYSGHSLVVVDAPLLHEVTGIVPDEVLPSQIVRQMWAVPGQVSVSSMWYGISAAGQQARSHRRAYRRYGSTLPEWGDYQRRLQEMAPAMGRLSWEVDQVLHADLFQQVI